MRVAISDRDTAANISTLDLTRNTLSRLTTETGPVGADVRRRTAPFLGAQPVWSPDGRFVVYMSNRVGQQNLFRQSADGTGSIDRLTTSPNIQWPRGLSPDGKMLLYAE